MVGHGGVGGDSHFIPLGNLHLHTENLRWRNPVGALCALGTMKVDAISQGRDRLPEVTQRNPIKGEMPACGASEILESLEQTRDGLSDVFRQVDSAHGRPDGPVTFKEKGVGTSALEAAAHGLVEGCL